MYSSGIMGLVMVCRQLDAAGIYVFPRGVRTLLLLPWMFVVLLRYVVDAGLSGRKDVLGDLGCCGMDVIRFVSAPLVVLSGWSGAVSSGGLSQGRRLDRGRIGVAAGSGLRASRCVCLGL